MLEYSYAYVCQVQEDRHRAFRLELFQCSVEKCVVDVGQLRFQNIVKNNSLHQFVTTNQDQLSLWVFELLVQTRMQMKRCHS